MKNIKLFVILALLTANISIIHADTAGFNADTIFKEATNEYDKKNYELATTLYKSILDNDRNYDNFEINFNLGSCYFKLKKYGESRFYFERALCFKPYDRDLQHNLNVLYAKITDDPKMASQEILAKRLLYCFDRQTTIWFINITVFLSIIFVLIFIITKANIKFAGIISLAAIILSLGGFIYFGLQRADFNKQIYVVKSESTNVYLSPNDTDSVLVTINCGAKGPVIDNIGSFIKIKMTDGSSGWIRRTDVISNDEI